MDLRITAKINDLASRQVNKPSRYGELITIQLENVSNKVFLSKILRAIVTDYKTIIGAIRVADYNTKILDSVVFLQFYDREEAELMLQSRTLFLFGQIVKFSNPYLVHGRIPFAFTHNSESGAILSGIPIPMAVLNLHDKVESNTTIHLIKVLESFETHSIITSFRFAFDYKRNIIRKFGTVTFLKRQDALDSQQKEHIIIGNKLDVQIPHSFPVMLHNSMAGLLNKGSAEFTTKLRDANWYHANLGDNNRPLHPIPTSLDVIECPEISNIPLPLEAPQPIVEQTSRQLLDQAFQIAGIGDEINRLNSGQLVVTPPPSPVLSLGCNEDPEDMIKEPNQPKKRKLN